MRLFLLTLIAALVALATAGNVVINGVCRDCSPPDAETLVVGDKAAKDQPGYITFSMKDKALNTYEPLPATGDFTSAPHSVPEGYSGPLPGFAYVHNKDCNNCDIRA